MKSKTLHSWGGRKLKTPVFEPIHINDSFPWEDAKTFLGHGWGRSYGDCAFNSQGAAFSSRYINKIGFLDEPEGILEVQAGVSLGEILSVVVPKGFFLPVVPGTKDVTVGGAIANDIHGKNHHCEGSFGHHVLEIVLLRSDQGIVHCSFGQNEELFRATIGGMGLTGMILSAKLRLTKIASSRLDVRLERFGRLDDFDRLCGSSDVDYTHTVAWIDALAPRAQLGRGIFMSGRWSQTPGKLKAHSKFGVTVPPMPISPLWNPLLKVFNQLYYYKCPAKPVEKLMHYNGFFFPLDALKEWSRLYGPAGLTQFQAVVPKNQFESIRAILEVARKAGQGSFLGVLKKFGDMPNIGMMSFPMPGYTIALDFANHKKATPVMLTDMAKIVMEAGGRFYSAKDSGYQTPEAFVRGYQELTHFKKFLDPQISSDLWRRLYI